ncbi:hypothetical protein JOAD_238 [Erwinia phage vB_EamM_Joad]|uniref:Uncharacterized protein n=1 Tax=Erwinia phage vB_EamM_Joad TaxID=2026081 RepID=A0A223LGZ7_9CAUD|nr:hypothetical protein JOAD_238 [Erwinia phage vB_EamM_Joad]
MTESKKPFSQDTMKALSVITRFNDVIGNTNVLRSLYRESQKEWAKSVNANNGEHLIKSIHTAGFKTDAVQAYVSVLAKIFLSSQGANLSAWSKNSLAEEHALTAAVISRMGTKLYDTNDQLFTDVATKVLGFDLYLVEYVLASEGGDKAVDKLVAYVTSQFDDLVGAENAEIYFDELIEHLKHIDLIQDRDNLFSTALHLIVGYGETDGYAALLKAAQNVLGYVIGDRTGEQDKVFTFPPAKL